MVIAEFPLRRATVIMKTVFLKPPVLSFTKSVWIFSLPSSVIGFNCVKQLNGIQDTAVGCCFSLFTVNTVQSGWNNV